MMQHPPGEATEDSEDKDEVDEDGEEDDSVDEVSIAIDISFKIINKLFCKLKTLRLFMQIFLTWFCLVTF